MLAATRRGVPLSRMPRSSPIPTRSCKAKLTTPPQIVARPTEPPARYPDPVAHHDNRSGSTITMTMTVIIHFDEDDTNVTAWWTPKPTVQLCVPRIGFRNPRRLRVCSGEETAVAHHSQRPGLNTATTSLLPATTSAPSPHLGCRALLRSRIWLPSRQTAYTVEGNRRLWARSASKICTWQQLQAARLMQSNAQSRGGQPPTSFPRAAIRRRTHTVVD